MPGRHFFWELRYLGEVYLQLDGEQVALILNAVVLGAFITRSQELRKRLLWWTPLPGVYGKVRGGGGLDPLSCPACHKGKSGGEGA